MSDLFTKSIYFLFFFVHITSPPLLQSPPNSCFVLLASVFFWVFWGLFFKLLICLKVQVHRQQHGNKRHHFHRALSKSPSRLHWTNVSVVSGNHQHTDSCMHFSLQTVIDVLALINLGRSVRPQRQICVCCDNRNEQIEMMHSEVIRTI